MRVLVFLSPLDWVFWPSLNSEFLLFLSLLSSSLLLVLLPLLGTVLPLLPLLLLEEEEELLLLPVEVLLLVFPLLCAIAGLKVDVEKIRAKKHKNKVNRFMVVRCIINVKGCLVCFICLLNVRAKRKVTIWRKIILLLGILQR